MYINFWYALAETADVPDDKPHRVHYLMQNFVLFRDQSGKVHCLHDVCSHRGGSLGKGKLNGDNVECPYHGWQFGGDGHCKYIPSLGKDNQKIPARTKVDSYPTHEEHGVIWAFLGDLPEEERPPLLRPHNNPNGQEYAGDQWRWVTQTWPLKSNYERNVENGIDPGHNEFVHERHGFGGGRLDTYKVQEYDVNPHDWGGGFMLTFQAPPSTHEAAHKGETSRKEEGDLEAGAGHSGPNNVWTYIHLTPTNWMHQYLYETPIDEFNTKAFNISMCNFLPPDVADDDDIRDMNGVIAEDDVIVLEEIHPRITPDNMTQEVMMPADKMIVAYRNRLREWDANGWRIDADQIRADANKKVYAIPSPGRRTEKGWLFDPVPLKGGGAQLESVKKEAS